MPLPLNTVGKALWLLGGPQYKYKDPNWEMAPPSATTTPTEKECYAATARVLTDIASYLSPHLEEPQDDWFNVLMYLAGAFSATATHPKGQGRRRIVVKNRSTKMRDSVREGIIARLVYDLHKQGKSYTEAYKGLAKKIGLKDTSQIIKAYSNHRHKWEQITARLVHNAIKRGGKNWTEACRQVAKQEGFKDVSQVIKVYRKHKTHAEAAALEAAEAEALEK